jgi:hypothetical protein
MTVDIQNLDIPKPGSYAMDLWVANEVIAHAQVEFL